MTSWLAHYGVFAVFILMMIDAVFPTASELVMLYGGALASGALTHEVHVLGWEVTGLTAFLAVVLAGVLGYQLGSIGGWWIGKRGGLPFLERHGRWLHLTPERLERAERWFASWKGGRYSSAGSHRSPGRSSRSPPDCSAWPSAGTTC